MADKESRTEAPTDKKLKESREQGQIARSQDLVSWGALLIGISILQSTVGKAATFLVKEMNELSNLIAKPELETAMGFMASSVTQAMVIVAPLALVWMGIGVAGHFLQVRFVLAWKALKPDFKRMNPISGFKRMFSKTTYFNAGKDLLKIAVLGFVAYKTLWHTVVDFSGAGTYSIGVLMGLTATAVIGFIKMVAMVGVGIGVLDYFYQRHTTGEQLKMSKDEVKQEGKAQEGSPELKGKIRQKQSQMSRNRMMTAMKDADVVVVNPVHVAVAIKYDRQKGAPKVIAKGAGFVAEKIREKALEHDVPLVQDIPLARTLHRMCEIDDEVPFELFEAVAKMLAFVFGLKNRGAAQGFHKMPGTPELDEYEAQEARRKAAEEAAADGAKVPTTVLDLVGAK